MLEAVGFDLDGTLLVADRDRETLLHAACDRVDAPRLSRAAYLRAHRARQGGADREAVFAALLADHGGTTVDPAALADAYDALVTEATAPLAGADRLVTELRERYRVGLLTDGPVGTQRRKVARTGWTDLDAVVVTGALPAPKPDDRAFTVLCEALGTAPEATAYVGDAPEADVAGAAAAGLRAVQVLYEGGPEPHPGATATVERSRLVERLPALLDELE